MPFLPFLPSCRLPPLPSLPSLPLPPPLPLPVPSGRPARRRARTHRRSAPSKCRALALTFVRPNTIIRSHDEQMIVFDSDDRGRFSEATRAPIATGDTG
ncbi:hypothetical protein C7H84_14870 [Burkholderia sp. Nafp2/4-1b]|nr:hypothetical protein C7H84_14870 [Burkholderia sp. Nafp2/4-1b]